MGLSEAKPPRRAPHYFWIDAYGWSARQCARNLVDRLAFFAGRTEPLTFTGDANGTVSVLSENYEAGRAQLSFTCEHGEGVIDISTHDSDWVLIELRIGGALTFRAWADDPYEEKEFWPDDSDGDGEGPGRISKRGTWLTIAHARFPDVTLGESGVFRIEDAANT